MEPLFILLLALIGIHPVVLVGTLSLNHLYQYWLHNQHVPKLGPLEWFLNTPSHHGRNIQYCDKNFGGTFIIFDRIFGTFEEDREPVDYGIMHPLQSRDKHLPRCLSDTLILLQKVPNQSGLQVSRVF
ncbi:MAG: sterol desaturase/sphingolipid hydroxylase (fatty acid hydroxylase superfamily) [Candidatus Azotimanducaceae bacterium]|jgi:sterol desaturase/sphingolipid hydroxylase (fatty acid hydroxylase superfamily)